MSPKMKYHKKCNITKTEMSPKPKIQKKKKNITKTKISPKIKFH